MIKKILFKNQNKTQLFIAMLGALLGFTFLITSIHYLIRINQFGEGQEILGDNTIIIQKKVTNFTTLQIASTSFSENEIKTIQEQPFIKSVKPIINNGFGVSLQTASDLVPYFRTDVFVQTVDADFLKMKADKWKWSKDSKYVPIILPREFLVMLNTFASAKGIPQVSEDLAMSIPFKFKLYNHKNKEYREAKIIAFTSKVSAILVPESFMKYGNTNFATNIPSKTTQLMITVKKGQFGAATDFLSTHFYESRASSMLIGKLKSMAGILFSILIGISFITLFLAGLVMIQYAQLIISKNKYEITVLLRQGYAPKIITRVISRYFIRVFALISFLAFIIFAGVKYFVDQLLLDGGIHIDTAFTWISIVAICVAFLIYTLVNLKNAKREILKSC